MSRRNKCSGDLDPEKLEWLGLVIIQLEMVLCSPRALRCKSFSNALPRIRRRACLGKPRRMDSDIWQVVVSASRWTDSWWGEIKMALEWGFVRVFRTQVVVTNVWSTGCVHTSCRTHISLVQSVEQFILIHFSRVCAHTHGSRIKVCAVRESWLTISSSPFCWCFTRLLRCFLITSLTPRVSLPYSRNSCRGLSRPRSAGPVHFRNSEDDFGYMANLPHSTSHESNQPDKMVPADDDVTPINDPDHDSICDFSKTAHENTRWFGVLVVCESPYPTEHSQEWRPQSTLRERAWKHGRESKGEGLWKQKQENESSHRQAIGIKGRVVAKTKMKELLLLRGLQCIIVWGKVTSTYWRSWTLRIHQSKSWLRQRRTYWCGELFMSSSTKAAVHLGLKDVETNRMFMNVYVEEIKYLFSIVQNWCWKIMARLWM